VTIFKAICNAVGEDDGLQFDAGTVSAERITEGADYEGVRIKFVGYLENARIPIQIDFGFGDVITPAPVETEIPSLLDQSSSTLLTYPKESVVSEKFEAMISLGIANSRMISEAASCGTGKTSLCWLSCLLQAIASANL
jgi:hypothetical protein